MLGIFKRKKLDEHGEAKKFVFSLLDTVDQGFPELASLINQAPEFVSPPTVQDEDSDAFILIALSANIKSIEQNLPAQIEGRLINAILSCLSGVFEASPEDLWRNIQSYKSFISKVNHPSTNLVYGMSKAVFYKYNLAGYQEEYFKNVNAPNPIFLKRLDEVMDGFLWDWEALKEHHG